MPSSSRPGIGRSRASVAPPARTTASNCSRSASAVMSTPTLTPVLKTVPSEFIWSRRRSMCRFSILNSGMPYRRSPPMRSARSNTVTMCPARVSCCAAARPAGPEPTTATFLPVERVGCTGLTQPSSKARSMSSTSTCLMVTGSWLMPRTHDASQGAGHSRPVNSGKLLVACRRSLPSSKRNGTGRRTGSSRDVCFRKPLGSPTSCLHHCLVHVLSILLRGLDGQEHLLVIAGHHLREVIDLLRPVGEDARRNLGARLVAVTLDGGLQPGEIVTRQVLEIHQFRVEVVLEHL